MTSPFFFTFCFYNAMYSNASSAYKMATLSETIRAVRARLRLTFACAAAKRDVCDCTGDSGTARRTAAAGRGEATAA
jgi:hypothetical protein